MAVERKCEWCGEKFYIAPSAVKRGRGKFCSRDCRSKYQRGENSPSWKGGEAKIICEQCEKEFNVKQALVGIRRFCSRKCGGLWRSENMRGENSSAWKGKIRKVCEQCGKEFDVYPYRGDEAKFCSRTCQGKWKSENMCGEINPLWKERIKKICEQCGQEFGVIPYSANVKIRKFCSPACYGKWQSKNRHGENGAHWKGGNVKTTCEWCGKEFYIIPSRAKMGWGRFCSRTCMGKWQSENMRGEKAANWRGGLAFELYGIEFDDELKKLIRERDDYTCAICGDPGQIVHHISYVKTDNSTRNLITLCQKCHGKTNGNRDYWKAALLPIARGAEMARTSFV